MRYFVSIAEGDTPSSAKPVLASEDPTLVRAVLTALVERLGGIPEALQEPEPTPLVRVTRPCPDHGRQP
jgi:hypothetical protein